MSEPLTPVPSLDKVIADPETLTELPRAVIVALRYRADLVRAACDRALALSSDRGVAGRDTDDPAPDEPLDVEAAARCLGISPATLYRGAKSTYASLVVPTGTRNLRFSAAAIEAYKRRRRP